MSTRLGLAIMTALMIVVMIVILPGKVVEAGTANGEGDGSEIDLSTEVMERMENRKHQVKELLQNRELARERSQEPLEEKVYVRGELVNFEEFGQGPIIREGRTLVPLRTINVYLGAETNWDGELEKVTIRHGDTTIEMIIGQTDVIVNGQTHGLDVAGELTQQDRTIVPLRFISDILGESVTYHEETGEIDVGIEFDEIEKVVDERKSPVEVVNSFWELYADGKLQEAYDKMIKDEIFEMGELDPDSVERFEIEAYDYEVEDDLAIVDIYITKPDFRQALNEYFERVTKEVEAMLEDGASDDEIEDKIEEVAAIIMMEVISDVQTIKYEDKVELQLFEGEWKISDWVLENMESRWQELEEELNLN